MMNMLSEHNDDHEKSTHHHTENPMCTISDGVLMVYPEIIRQLVGHIGDGIEDLDVESSEVSTRHILPAPTHEIYQNEVKVYFIENAYGYIDMDEWNGLKNTLDKFVGKGGFKSYSINPQNRVLTLEFTNKFPMEEH